MEPEESKRDVKLEKMISSAIYFILGTAVLIFGLWSLLKDNAPEGGSVLLVCAIGLYYSGFKFLKSTRGK